MEVSVSASFVTRWSNSGGAKRANYQFFLSELCGVLGVEGLIDQADATSTKEAPSHQRALPHLLDGGAEVSQNQFGDGKRRSSAR